ncbi:MAG: FAD-dependent oxidoreductase [Desulfobacterales bacterium]|nr:FAD-dependent oxidoreductase [Desulfobacterales bacterium]
MSKFERLFESVKIGNLEIKNRFVMPPMMTRSAENGTPSEPTVAYYEARAKGGTGLIIVEFTKCETGLEPMVSPYHLRIDTEEHQKAFTALTDAVHRSGGKIALQISPGLGSWVIRKQTCPAGYTPVGPTTFANPEMVARPLTSEEVETLVQSFGDATLRAKNAGFDAVEIHGHSSYLLGQFMSPYVNTRDDKYGDLWRLPVEMLESAKGMAGADYPVIFRISGDEFIEGGRTIEGSVDICRRMEEAGVDCINVSDGTYYTGISNRIFPYMTLPRATYEPECKAIRKAVNVPLILAGRLSNPNDALQIVDEGTTDFVAIGRGLVADPELVNKLEKQKENEIRPCMSCNYCIGSMMSQGCMIKCAVNARVFKEKEYKTGPAEKQKKIFVIGGGPGGMEAARIAAMRGHQVTLYEKGDKLGGYLPAAATPKHKKDILPYLTWLSSNLESTDVNIILNKEATPELVLEAKPDAVIIAAGATPVLPKIPGIEGPNVVSAIDVLLGKATTGDEIVVAGGGLIGCDVGIFLSDMGKRVTIVEMLEDVVLDMVEADGSRAQIVKLLAQKGITCRPNLKMEEIADNGIIASDNDGTKQTIQGDTVVLAMGLQSETGLYNTLKGKISELHAIGDCAEVRKIGDAVREGFFAAYAL